MSSIEGMTPAHELLFEHGLTFRTLSMCPPEFDPFEDQQKPGVNVKMMAIACESFEHATLLRSDYKEAYLEWGVTLKIWSTHIEEGEREELLLKACEKFATAVALKSDYCEALHEWGLILLSLSRQAKDEHRLKLFSDACDRLFSANIIKPTAFNTVMSLGTKYALDALHSTGVDRILLLRESVMLFERSIEAVPHIVKFPYILAQLKYRLGVESELPESKVFLQEALDAFKALSEGSICPRGIRIDIGNTLVSLARVSTQHEKIELLSLAVSEYRKQIAIGASPEVNGNLARALLMMSEFEDVVVQAKLLKEACQLFETGNPCDDSRQSYWLRALYAEGRDFPAGSGTFESMVVMTQTSFVDDFACTRRFSEPDCEEDFETVDTDYLLDEFGGDRAAMEDYLDNREDHWED